MEGSDGDSQSLLHILHHLPQCPLWFPGGSQHRYLLPQVQTASAVSGHEGTYPVHDISGPAQGVRCLGQGQIPRDIEGEQRGTSGLPHPLGVLGQASDGGFCGRVLRGDV